MRRTTALVATALVIVTVIAACGGDDHAKANNKQWAKGFCTGLSKWRQATTASSGSVQTYLATPNLNATTAKASLANYLGDASDATDQLRRDLRKVGAPDIANGGRVVTSLEKGSAAVHRALGEAKDLVNGLPVDNTQRFQTGLTAVNTKVTQGFDAFGAALNGINRLDDGRDLVRAERSIPQCRALLS